MAIDVVKARRSGDSLVVTITKKIMTDCGLVEGDSILVRTSGNNDIILSRVAPEDRLKIETLDDYLARLKKIVADYEAIVEGIGRCS